MIPLIVIFASAAFAQPTFHRDVEPVLQRRCQSCHRAGEIGRMPLETYAQVRPWAKAIREAVLARRMPPWFAESASVAFENDARLTPAEIQTIDTWVQSGAPRGNPSTAPRPVTPQPVIWTRGWNIGTPAVILTMPQPVQVPARRELDYQFIILPLNAREDRWVTAAEIRPGFRAAVHHVVAYVREPSTDWLRDTPSGKPFARPGATKADILAIYAPGQPAMILREGMAKKIPAGSDIVLQIHYTPSGTAGEDRTALGIRWSSTPPAQRVLTLQIDSTHLHIPPGDANYSISASGTLPNDALLLSMFPHMHLRGKAFEYAIVQPGGRVETLLRVAPYDFGWQLDYRLASPRMLAKGTRLRCTAWYDNSRNNPRNPDPDAEVEYGEQSGQEMMVGFFDIAVPPSVDKNTFFRR